MKKLLLLLLGIASIPAAFSQGGSGIDWAADLDYLASELPAKHCNLFAKYDKAQFETAIGAIKASAGEAGDFATALKTQQRRDEAHAGGNVGLDVKEAQGGQHDDHRDRCQRGGHDHIARRVVDLLPDHGLSPFGKG